MRYSWLFVLPLQLLLARESTAQWRPAAQPPKPLYDSTTAKVDLSASPGVSHKTAMQAARTFGKIGAHQALNYEDSVFLRTWSPGYLAEPGATTPAPKRPAARKH